MLVLGRLYTKGMARSFRLFAQVIDRHLCTELMRPVCNSICRLPKVINIDDNTLGSSILTHIYTYSICPVAVQICTKALSYINIFFLSLFLLLTNGRVQNKLTVYNTNLGEIWKSNNRLQEMQLTEVLEKIKVLKIL